VRSTAAKQLAQLAVKSLITDVAIVEEDVKTVRQNVTFQDDQAWSELLSVVARVCCLSLQISSHITYNSPGAQDPSVSTF
jgi:hypothetical protein